MRGVIRRTAGAVMVPGLFLLASGPWAAWADDVGFLGRLFRLGGNPAPSPAARGGSTGARPADPYASGQPASAFGDIGSGGSSAPRAGSTSRAPGLTPSGGPIPGDGPATPELSNSPGDQPRLTPRPRTSAAVTAADPLVTRMAIGRSNDGSQFGMFLQVFADGTVIDSEGVHRLPPKDIRPIVEAIQNGELSRLRGHCGTPSNDFTEYVHLVAFERRMGRLQAHSFSYGGNPQGCDGGIRYLHAALEALQAKLSRPASAGLPAASPPPAAVANPPQRTDSAPAPGIPFGGPAPPLPDPATTASGGVISLTPPDQP